MKINKRGKVRYFSILTLFVFSLFILLLINHPIINITGQVILDDSQIQENFVFVPQKDYTKEDAFNALLEANKIIN